MNSLIEHIDQLHTTEMGAGRIKRNLQLETEDVVRWCKLRILDKQPIKSNSPQQNDLAHCSRK